MKTLVWNVNEINWVEVPQFKGVYAKDLVKKEDGMDVTNKYIKIVPGGEILVHTHDVTEAFYILEGTASVLVNEERIPLKVGTMISAPAGVPHGIKNETDEDVILLANFGVK
ncbi:cupin domain-containing protein [Crassaminicella profunda]|uniref:cupin domain-containing protein n=1 Tax=Crassaminicella profunda TaxID=1286698 RepID=UPI001CA62E49|nr:cupin domain-containing protein [Crassaminicella profunda]QZY56070.1 cupin domain-containing protein [Crassaminicella profunda]